MTTFEKCDSMEKYVSEVVDTAYQLNNIGLVVDEEWVGMIASLESCLTLFVCLTQINQLVLDCCISVLA